MALKIDKPYMMRQDGSVIEIIDRAYHPYIWYDKRYDSEDEAMTKLMTDDKYQWMLFWFFQNTKHIQTKELIKEFVVLYYFYHFYTQNEFPPIPQKIKDGFDIDKNGYDTILDMSKGQVKNKLDLTFDILNKETNQEFLRFRLGHKYAGGTDPIIYFRVSSAGFNWFNNIWKLVYDNNNITNVTIVKDGQAFGDEDGYKEYYVHNGEEFNVMPRNEFITIGGNPVVEHEEDRFARLLSKGWSLMEIGNKFGTTLSIIGKYEKISEEYFSKNFTNLL